MSAELITMILLSLLSLFNLKKGKQPDAMVCVPISISANGSTKTLECKLPKRSPLNGLKPESSAL